MSSITKHLYIFFLAAILLPGRASAFEPSSTHAGLTQEAISFYNVLNSSDISTADGELIIEGSVKEDSPDVRALNHFYDPVRGIGFNGGRTSKVWALGVPENEYSWESAIKYYAEGDKTRAYLALGHVLHLIEDAAVPDHTRNDSHIEGSPFEDWAKRGENRETLRGLYLGLLAGGETARVFDSLGAYFDYLADYSNHNFFSKDTIVSEFYNEPVVLEYDGKYGYGRDSLAGDNFKLLMIKKDMNGVSRVLTDNQDTSVLSDYFDRLAKQAILSGAGVIELFFKEATLARVEYVERQRKLQGDEVARAVALSRELSGASQATLALRGLGFLLEDYLARPVAGAVGTLASGFTDGARMVASAGGNVASVAAYTASSLANMAVDKALALVLGSTSPVAEVSASPSDGQPPKYFSAELGSPTPKLEVPEVESVPVSVPVSVPAPVVPAVEAISSAPAPVIVSSANLEAEASSTSAADILEISASPSDGQPPKYFSATLGSPTPKLEAPGGDGGYVATPIVYEATPIPESYPIASVLGGGIVDPTRGPSVAETLPVLPAVTPEEGAASSTADTTEGEPFAVSPDTSGSSPLFDWSAVGSASDSPIVINEVSRGVEDEQWVEIFNRSSRDADISDVILYSKTDSSPFTRLVGVVPARGYLVVPIPRALSGDGESLALARASTTLDEMPMCRNWCGVPATRTIERYDPDADGGDASNWSANNFIIRNNFDGLSPSVAGTPGARNSLNYLINRGAPVRSDVVLLKRDSPYLVNDITQVISEGATLSIEPGVVIKFRNGARLLADGDIVARGTEAEPVVFTAFADDSYGGDTDSASSTPTLGSWFGIELSSKSSGSAFSHAIFRYGGNYGQGFYRKAMLYVDHVSPTITDSVFEYSKGYGVWLDYSSSFVSRNVFRGNHYFPGQTFSVGLYAYDGAPEIRENVFERNFTGLSIFKSGASVAGNGFTGNSYAAQLNDPYLNTITDNHGDQSARIRLVGNLSTPGATTTLVANQIPYFFYGNVGVPANSALEILEGVVIKNSTVSSATRLDVYGRLVIDTSTTSGVIFETDQDSTSKMGWLGIKMNKGATSHIKGATIRNASMGIGYFNSPIDLEDVLFETNTTAVQAGSLLPIINATGVIFRNNGINKNPPNLW